MATYGVKVPADSREDMLREIESLCAGDYRVEGSGYDSETRAVLQEAMRLQIADLEEKLLPADVRTLRELQRRKANVESQIPGIRAAIEEESARWNSYAPYPDESICANYTLNRLYSDLRFKLDGIDKYADEIDDLQEAIIDSLTESN